MNPKTLPVHPFPARMAPELALDRLPVSETAIHVLDPMMGSGTIPVLAGVRGHVATGFDLDPLAHLIATTWARPLDKTRYLDAAERVSRAARQMGLTPPLFADDETREFADRWFDPVARGRLASLARAISSEAQVLRPALWCAFSRLIITKDVGASLARDVSHSRPHRVRDTTDFNPVDKFERSAREVQRRHELLSPTRPGAARLDLGLADARDLPVEDATVDMVMTSPPYLVAIDYLRGHRLTLVWMGYSIAALRDLRGTVIGAERSLRESGDHEDVLAAALGDSAPDRAYGVLRRYVSDIVAVLREVGRVLKPSGIATFVVADATLFGLPVAVSSLLDTLAHKLEFERTEWYERELPADRRYLPPPKGAQGDLARRMRREVCLSYKCN
jgi:SAM-dependent methyltransferase